MRFIFLTLPLAVSSAVLDPRQLGSPARVAGVDKAEATIRKGTQRTITKFGPYTLRGASTGGGDSTLSGQTFFNTLNSGFCNEKGPCTILGGHVGVMYTNGQKADPSNGIYIHHVLTSDTTKHQTPWLSACGAPTRPVRSVSSFGSGTGFMGVGEDSADGLTYYTTPDGERNTGYHLNRGDTFLANFQLVNYNKETKQVYVFYDTEWVPGLVGKDTKNAVVSVTSCGSPTIKLSQSGPTNTTSGKFYFMEDGELLRGRGHLHDGGVQVDMFINNKFVCASQAVYGDKEDKGMGGHSHGGSGGGGAAIKTINSMTPCDKPIPVKKGDTMSMTVEYDLSKHPLRKSAGGHEAGGVMGMWSLQFVPK